MRASIPMRVCVRGVRIFAKYESVWGAPYISIPHTFFYRRATPRVMMLAEFSPPRQEQLQIVNWGAGIVL